MSELVVVVTGGICDHRPYATIGDFFAVFALQVGEERSGKVNLALPVSFSWFFYLDVIFRFFIDVVHVLIFKHKISLSELTYSSLLLWFLS